MVTVTANHTLQCDPKLAAKVMDDFPNIAKWSRGVQESHATGDVTEGVGATRKCVFDAKGKQWVEEVQREAGNGRWVIEIVNGSMPMKHASAVFTIDGAQASVTFDYGMKGIMAPMGYLMKGSMRKTFVNVLADLDARAQELAPKARKSQRKTVKA